MEKSLKIASSSDLLSLNVAKQIISENDGFEYAKLSKKANLDKIKQELYAKEYDMACIQLNSVPFTLPDGIVLAGVSKRFDAALSFIGKQACLDGDTIRDIKAGTKVLVKSEVIKDQMIKLLPDVECIVNNISFEQMAQKFMDQEVDAFICPHYEIGQNEFDINGLYHWQFSPYEMVGTPAEGVVTYICRMDDIVVRKFIKDIHQTDTSRCTNIERKIMKSFETGTIGAFCFKDERNNFQIHASHSAEATERCFFTQSTSAGLAEKIIEILSHETNLSSI